MEPEIERVDAESRNFSVDEQILVPGVFSGLLFLGAQRVFAHDGESERPGFIEPSGCDKLIPLFAAKDDSARAAHVVLALHERDFVLVSPQEGQERIAEIVRMLPFPVIVDHERRVTSRPSGQNLYGFGLNRPFARQIPALRAFKKRLDRIADRLRRGWPFGINAVFKAAAHQDGVDRVGDLLDKSGDGRGLLVFDNAEKTLIVPVGSPGNAGITGQGLNDAVDLVFRISAVKLCEQIFQVHAGVSPSIQ